MGGLGRRVRERSEVFPSTSFLYLVLELSQEERQQVLYCVVFAQDGREAHDDRGQSRLHVLIRVRHQFLEAARRKTKREHNELGQREKPSWQKPLT